jgi:hypothetical protein
MPYFDDNDSLLSYNYLYLTRSDFELEERFYVLTNEAFAPTTYKRMEHWFITTNLADVYVDYVEYMDKEQGWPLWSGIDSLRDTTFAHIERECEDLLILAQQKGTQIVGFENGELWPLGTTRSMGLINAEVFAADDELRGHYPRTRFNTSQVEYRWLNYFDHGNPKVFDPHLYPFAEWNSIGNQEELDSLSDRLEESYQYCNSIADTAIAMLFKLQVHDLVSSPTDPLLRIPRRSEIFAETYMALAHGAQGVSFFKYRTHGIDSLASMHGLVNEDYQHPVGAPWYYNERWCAVQEVFAQLDSIGDVLVTLERDTAYCVYTDEITFGSDLLPITNVEFTEDDTNYIEVGQFHTTQGDTDYVILVNRRTDADRHINIETNLTGAKSLHDIYTGEQFISSTGNFYAIPFDSGEGRVFRISEEMDASLEKDTSLIIPGLVSGIILTMLAFWILL